MAQIECKGCSHTFNDWHLLAPPWDVTTRDSLICETCWLQWIDGEREIAGWPPLDAEGIDPKLRELAKQVILNKQEENNAGYLGELMAEDTTTRLLGKRGRETT